MEFRVLLVVGAFGVIAATGRPLPAFNLKCQHRAVGLSDESLSNPVIPDLFATDDPRPLFSWSVSHMQRNATQKASRVQVFRDSRLSKLYWDSGYVPSDRQELKYGGPKLVGGDTYYWKVTWWDHRGESISSKETGHFLAVTLQQEDWDKAKWLAPPPGMKTGPTFAKQIQLSKSSVSKTMLYISGLGYYDVVVNDASLNQLLDPPMFLTPGWTNYELRVGYVVYDVTAFLGKELTGSVNINVTLGMGWRNKIYSRRDSLPAPDTEPLVLRLILEVTYTDGSSQTEYSDNSWDVWSSVFVQDSIYNGETVDLSNSPSMAGKAVETPGPSGKMYLPSFPYIASLQVDNAIAITKIAPNSEGTRQIVDFKYNTAGYVKINVKDVGKGSSFSMHHAEVPQHPPYGSKDGSLYFANLRGALQNDSFTSNGKASTYQPTFTYHGFRYVQVTNYPRDLTKDDIQKVRTNSNVQKNSKFNSSISLLNSIQDNVMRGHLSNLMSVPTDCDQRDERLGWMGDAGLSADGMALNFQMDTFFPNFLTLIADEQMKGAVPDVVPFYRGGGRPSDPAWGAAYPQIAWVLYKYYGDTATAKDHLAGLLAYIDFMISQVQSQGMGKLYAHYGDWVPPPPQKKVSESFTSAFSFLLNVKQVGELARALKDEANANRMDAAFKQYADQFNSAFLINGKYIDDLQVSYVLPLALDIVPADQKDKISAYFINKLTSTDKTHVTGGIIGTKFLLPVLTSLKRNDLAMKIVQNTDYPSWGYMILNTDEPATTIWELWNANTAGPGMNSRNHHMYSSVSGWLQTDMVGLRQPDGSYGYNVLDLYPASSLDLSAASVELKHPRPIKFSWHRRGGIQCGQAGEQSSKHGGLRLSCGEGTISKVLFASYGNAEGVCGYHRHGSCHAPQSQSKVEQACLGQRECTLPTTSDYWDSPCSGASKWLTVAVLCQKDGLTDDHFRYSYSSLDVQVSVPIGSRAQLNIPSYGLSGLQVKDNTNIIYSDGRLLGSTDGISSATWSVDKTTLQLTLSSGDYNLVVSGKKPMESHTVEANGTTGSAYLRCFKESSIITHINWVSYGRPYTSQDGVHYTDWCHSGAGLMVAERECLGRHQCLLPLDVELFGGHPCPDMEDKDDLKLIADYSCN